MARRVPLDIETYNRKRDFTKTKEPKGRKLKGSGGGADRLQVDESPLGFADNFLRQHEDVVCFNR